MKNCHIHKACVLLVMGMFMLLPFTSKAQRQVQTLGRGVVVAKNGSNALITWRRLAQEPEQARWNIYVNGTKLNTEPLTNTNFQTTSSKLPVGSKVTVTLINGTE